MEVLFKGLRKFNTSGLFGILIAGVVFAVEAVIGLFVVFGIIVLLSLILGIIIKTQNKYMEPQRI